MYTFTLKGFSQHRTRKEALLTVPDGFRNR